MAAAKHNHLHVLKWARQNGCPWSSDTCEAAASAGHLEILQWAHAQGCVMDLSTCEVAAQNNHLHVLQWARSNGCPWEADKCLERATDPEARAYITSEMSAQATAHCSIRRSWSAVWRGGVRKGAQLNMPAKYGK
eukprot:TRINITY_DN11846_c0_g1_i1.p2 TRINITY_DN11846_c0_g1~~TRINITY_DN11846_c0_g1_i1.p2  ORF type:complete len:135 (-),score=34.59 TRINITY_DN11846_c0_g1_i1:457-861(-)